MTLGIIGIIAALVIFLYGAYKNVSVLYLAPLAGVIVAVTNGINPTTAFTSYYIGAVEENAATGAWEVGGLIGMIKEIFPTVFLGGLFGKVLADSGAANTIASTLTQRFVLTVTEKEKQAKRAVLILLLIECILAYGGVDGFVAVFATFQVAMFMANTVGIPRRFVPAMLCLSSGANSAPFVLSINNIMCMAILGTSPGAAAIPGFICFIVIEAGIYFICSNMVVKAIKKGETFDIGPCQPIQKSAKEGEGPSFVIALIPLIVVFLLFAIVQDASLALVAGILVTTILMGQYFPKNGEPNGVGTWVGKIVDSLNGGAANGATAVMSVCAAAGFAAIVQHTEAFDSFVQVMFGLPFSPLILAMLLIIVIVAFTSSPPAALSMALPLIAGAYIWSGANAINPDALARTAAIAVSTFETLPVNGLIIMTTGLAQVKVKDAYLPMFLQTVVMTTIGTVLCVILVMAFPGIV